MKLRAILSAAFLAVAFLTFQSCGGAGSSSSDSGDWYYHWNCNGDSECLALNPTGAPSGTINEGPVLAMCTPLLTFAAKYWNIPPASNSCDQDANASAPTAPATLSTITVTPANKTMGIGGTQQYVATGTYSNATTANITAQVTWSKTGASASLTAGGLATGISTGGTIIRATLGSKTGSTNLSVTTSALTSIVITPANPTLAVGLSQSFTATGHFSDGSIVALTSATWSSGTPATAAIDSVTGIASALTAGTTTITATSGSISGSTTLTVANAALLSIAVTPTNPSIPVGYTRPFTAIGTYSNGTAVDITTSVTWTAGTPARATIGANTGIATGVSPGSTTITAVSGAVSGGTLLTVSTATLQTITVLPANPRVGTAAVVRFTAIGNFSDGSSSALLSGVTWTSSDTNVATVNATSGQATTLHQVGFTTVTASAASVSGNTQLTVTYTPTGHTWTGQNIGGTSPPYLYKVAWSGSQYVAVALGAPIYSSPEGLAWTLQTGPNYSSSSHASVTWGGTFFTAVGYQYIRVLSPGVSYSTGTISNSANGTAWTAVAPSRIPTFNGITWSGSTFVIVGAGGAIFTSSDGTNWNSRVSGTTQALNGVTWSGSQFLAVGAAGTALTSPDGITWALHATGSTRNLLSAAWSGNKFIAVGETGTVMTSPTGVTWTTQNSGLLVNFNDVACSTLLCIMVGDAGQIEGSPDGITWTGRSSGTTNNLNGVVWNGTQFLAVGGGGSVLVSP